MLLKDYTRVIYFVLLIFNITSIAIGIDVYNKNKDLKNKDQPKFGVLVFTLSITIVMLLLSIVSIFNIPKHNSYNICYPF